MTIGARPRGHRWTSEDARKASQHSNWAKSLSDTQKQEICQQLESGVSERQIARTYHVSKSTIHRIKENYSQQGDFMNPVDMEKVRTIVDTTILTRQEEDEVKEERPTLTEADWHYLTRHSQSNLDLNGVRFTYTTKGFTLGDIYAHQEKYLAIPPFQRPDMEDKRFGPLLVDTVLRGIPIDAPFAYLDKWKRPVRYYLLDGSQSLRALMRYRHGDFKTLTRGRYEEYCPHSPIAAIEPNRGFGELPFELRNDFDEYVVPYIVAETKEPIDLESVLPLLAEQFRRRQISRKLTTGQTLWSYPSAMKEIAERLSHHPIFRQAFGRKVQGYDKTRIRFTMGLMTIELTLSGLAAHEIKARRLTHLASGKFDALATPELEARCELLLTKAAHIFFGAEASTTTDMIVILQACLLLERAKVDLETSQRGCLASWFKQAKICRLADNWGGGFAKMQEKSFQDKFWSIQHDLLLQQPGLVKSRKEDEATALPFRF